jgi:3-hydroxymyristoyl/3-hydroxydecanoyl-(acyl carrier protein) dehydratase
LRFSIPYDHPSLAGHFPGRPIVPGVVLLDEAIALMLRDRPADRLVGLDDVKLLAPVLPGDEVAVTFAESAPGRLILTCAVAGHTVLRGWLRLGATG